MLTTVAAAGQKEGARGSSMGTKTEAKMSPWKAGAALSVVDTCSRSLHASQ